jgi:TatD DNase family protein
MKAVDTHCHLDGERFDSDREEVLKRAKENLEFIVNIGYDLESSKRSLALAKENEFVYATVGVHPTDIEGYDQEEKVVAIGEIGLDYHWMTTPKEHQKEIFRKQLELARRLKKPVVIHTREAMADTIEILKEYPEIVGVIHCYPGSIESAKELIDRFYLGIGGTLTFKNAKKSVQVVEEIPLEKVVLETDSPYLAPVPYRGERNEPIYVQEVAKKIAEIKGISEEEVIKITTENAKKLYRIEK